MGAARLIPAPSPTVRSKRTLLPRSPRPSAALALEPPEEPVGIAVLVEGALPCGRVDRARCIESVCPCPAPFLRRGLPCQAQTSEPRRAITPAATRGHQASSCTARATRPLPTPP